MAAMPGFRALLCACSLVVTPAVPVHATRPVGDASPAQIFMEICVAPDRRPATIHEKLIARGAEVISNAQPDARAYAVDHARFAYTVKVNGELDCGMIFREIDTDDLLPQIDRLLAITAVDVSVVGIEIVGRLPEATLIGARLVRQPSAPTITLTVHRIGDRVLLMRSERPHL